jgi:hypothetical protein
MKMTVTEITTGKFGNGNTNDNLKALITRKSIFFIPIPPVVDCSGILLILRSLTIEIADKIGFRLSLCHVWTVLTGKEGPEGSGEKPSKFRPGGFMLAKIKMNVESIHTYLIKGGRHYRSKKHQERS